MQYMTNHESTIERGGKPRQASDSQSLMISAARFPVLWMCLPMDGIPVTFGALLKLPIYTKHHIFCGLCPLGL